MSSSSGASRIGGFSAGLLALCGLLVGVGYLLPSSGSASDGYHAMSAPAAPVRLVIPALKVRAPIEPITVRDGVLDPPRNPRDVGWWRGSVRPGATHGQTVLTGHTVHTGGGVMDHLGRLRKGQLVKVVTRKGTMVYRTTSVVTWSKAELAKRSVQIFSQKREDERLVLITCSGWTGSEYTSNVVVFAEPLGVPDAKPATTTKTQKSGTKDS
jgi:LPXTG-site transpeptidase (sortase) family protein